MSAIHTGVYGDHAKPGGLNEWHLEEHFAQRRAEEAYTPASDALAFVPGWIANGRIERADALIQRGGLLAAAEARIRHGVEIEGWESEEAEQEFRQFYDLKTIQYAGMLAAKEARFQGVEINGWDK